MPFLLGYTVLLPRFILTSAAHTGIAFGPCSVLCMLGLRGATCSPWPLTFFLGFSPFRPFICRLPRFSSFSLPFAVALDLCVSFVFGLFDFLWSLFFLLLGLSTCTPIFCSPSLSPFVVFLYLCVLCLSWGRCLACLNFVKCFIKYNKYKR